MNIRWFPFAVRQTSTFVCRSHATYYFIAAGCHLSLKNYEKAQKLFDAVPELLEKKKIGGKDLPTEVWIKKKRKSARQCVCLWIDVYTC